MRRRSFIAATGATLALGVGRQGRSVGQPWGRLTQATPRPPPTSLNLLRNGHFQDDWLSLLPQPQTLHWAYATGFYHRRDFNPDGWRCTGGWRWVDADAPRGGRRLLLGSPSARVTQRLHWVAVHDEGSITGFPDAGGFPELREVSSTTPERFLRDLTLRVLVRGTDIPPSAAGVELGLCRLGKPTSSDPLGTVVKPLVSRASAARHTRRPSRRSPPWRSTVTTCYG